ncbi:MAG: hypothetical protein AAGD18_03950 [Actinomycetota bacterium]
MSTTTDSAATAGGNERPPRWALRGALGFVGVFIVFFSLNMSLGGFETLGWEGRSDFVDVLTALALELVAVPLLAWWILRSTAPADRQVALPAADGYQRISSRSRPRISGVGRCSSASIS